MLTQNKYKFAVVYKMGITEGLTSVREVAALSTPAKSPDCLLNVVTQPTDSWLSVTSVYLISCPFLLRNYLSSSISRIMYKFT